MRHADQNTRVLVMKKIFRLVHNQARQLAEETVRNAPDGYIVTISEPTRTLDQNAAQWPLLNALANQSQWPVNGAMVKISADDWKDVLTCAFRNEQPRIAQGYNGGMVLLGQRTSKFSKRDFSDWMEFLWSVVNERGVKVYEDVAA